MNGQVDGSKDEAGRIDDRKHYSLLFLSKVMWYADGMDVEYTTS